DALAAIDIKSGAGAFMQPGQVGFDATGANRHVIPVMIQWQGGVPHTVFPESVATSPLIKP
ncbi:MAG TPA: amino acid ABC transporter substrate-binding protein, partial [Ramlibacter sp.]|nr:amino acid ABC transporter substrate-binding protein [Ramlibacter sp.]